MDNKQGWDLNVHPDLDSIEDSSHGEGKCGRVLRYTVILLCSILAIIPIFWPFYIKVIDQYQRFVVFRLGKLMRPARGPGIVFFIPFVDDWTVVDLRVQSFNVTSQAMMTRDSVSVTVNAVVFLRVRDAIKAVVTVENYMLAISLLAQTVLRSVVGESELDVLLSQRNVVNTRLNSILGSETLPMGVEVVTVEVKDVVLPQNMQRVMGAQAEAERERRAKVINAQGEVQAAQNLLLAANEMSKNKNTMLLRYLHTLDVISTERNSTILFPVPLDLLAYFGDATRSSQGTATKNTEESGSEKVVLDLEALTPAAPLVGDYEDPTGPARYQQAIATEESKRSADDILPSESDVLIHADAPTSQAY